jgi:hypothetical protein
MNQLSERQIRNMAKQIDQLGLRMTELVNQIEKSGHPYADQMVWHLYDCGFYKPNSIAEGLVGMYLKDGHMRKDLDETIEGRIRWSQSNYKG